MSMWVNLGDKVKIFDLHDMYESQFNGLEGQVIKVEILSENTYVHVREMKSGYIISVPLRNLMSLTSQEEKPSKSSDSLTISDIYHISNNFNPSDESVTLYLWRLLACKGDKVVVGDLLSEESQTPLRKVLSLSQYTFELASADLVHAYSDGQLGE